MTLRPLDIERDVSCSQPSMQRIIRSALFISVTFLSIVCKTRPMCRHGRHSSPLRIGDRSDEPKERAKKEGIGRNEEKRTGRIGILNGKNTISLIRRTESIFGKSEEKAAVLCETGEEKTDNSVLPEVENRASTSQIRL